jgi:hypothetical protein
MADEAATPVPAITAEHLAADLLTAGLASPMEVFAIGAALPLDESSRLKLAKEGADLLVRSKLARFADEGRTTIELTNAGRYWALHGGWMAFLKELPPEGGGGRGRNPETEAMRSEFMRLRLRTFWWTFGLSVAGFVISILSMTIAIVYGGVLFR